MIQDLFKVPIYKVKLDLDVEKLQSFCSEHRNKDIGRLKSNIGGYHSNDLSLDEVSLQPLIEKIETHSSKFSKEFLGTEQVLDNMWININSYKDTNRPHNHPHCDISGVYYIKTPKNCGNIVFEHPALDVLTYYFKDKPKESNAYNAVTWWMPSEVNTLYLFPSWLNHCVEANENKTEERISISFNTYKHDL